MATRAKRLLGNMAPVQRFTAARRALRQLLDDESGQDVIEYALVGTLIGLSALIGIHGVANTIANMLAQVGNNFTNAV